VPWFTPENNAAPLTHSPAIASSSIPKPPNTSPASRSSRSRASTASPSSVPRSPPPESQTTRRKASHTPPQNQSPKDRKQSTPRSHSSASSPDTLRNPSRSTTSPAPIPKIFIFSILLSAAVWCGKTYRAYRHNAVVNRHRQNALATFEAFAKAASDVETKNAVLLQATQCIFSPQQTGYVSGEPESALPPVLEIVRNLGKSSR